MSNSKNEDKLNQICEYAQNNDMHISYNLILDILMDKKKDISGEEIHDLIQKLGKQNIIIDQSEGDEGYEEKSPSEPWKYIPAQVNISHRVMTISDVIDRLSNDEFDLNPEFQRKSNLWNLEKQSQLIESLMLKIPLPTFYFNAADEGKWVVIDGLQRLTTLNNFLVLKNFKLCGLEYLREFHDKGIDDLPRQYYRRIRETQINVYTVEKDTPSEVVYNIFKRINTAGMKLEPQEMRHALYRGNATKFIGRMAESESFIKATGGTIQPDRMLDREYITRYIAFTELDYHNRYKGNIDSYLIEALSLVHTYSETELKYIEEDFYEVMNVCFDIFGKYTFRRVNMSERRGPVNKAIFELWSICIHKLQKTQRKELVNRKETVLKKFMELLQRTDFSTWLKGGDRYSLESRIEANTQMLERILHD